MLDSSLQLWEEICHSSRYVIWRHRNLWSAWVSSNCFVVQNHRRCECTLSQPTCGLAKENCVRSIAATCSLQYCFARIEHQKGYLACCGQAVQDHDFFSSKSIDNNQYKWDFWSNQHSRCQWYCGSGCPGVRSRATVLCRASRVLGFLQEYFTYRRDHWRYLVFSLYYYYHIMSPLSSAVHLTAHHYISVVHA